MFNVENSSRAIKSHLFGVSHHVLGGALLGAALLLGACGGDKAGVDAVGKKITKMKSSAQADIITKIKTRKVSDAESASALKLIGLDQNDHENIKWASRSGSAGVYEYHNVTISHDDDDHTMIKKMVLSGVHLDEGAPRIDQIDLLEFTRTSDEDQDTISATNIRLLEPSADIVKVIGTFLEGDEDVMDDFNGSMKFSGASIDHLTIRDNEDDVTVNINHIGFGKSKSGDNIFKLNDLSILGQAEGGKSDNLNVKVGSIYINGANLDKYASAFSSGDEEVLFGALSKVNGFDPDYKDFTIADVDITVAGLHITLDNLKSENIEKNGVVHMHQLMSPLTITPPAKTENEDRGVKQAREMFEQLGYEKMIFTMEQNATMDKAKDRMVLTDTHLSLQDGFSLSMEMDVSGYLAYMNGIQAINHKNMSSMRKGKNLPRNGADVKSMVEKLQIHSAKFDLVDRSIIERGLKMAAKMSGDSVGSLRSKAKMGLAFLPMTAKTEFDQAFLSNLSSSLGSLLDHGGSLSIALDPKTPVSAKSLMKGPRGLDMEAMGLSVTHQAK